MTETTEIPPLQLDATNALSSPGERLQQARIAKGLSIEAVSERLKIVPSRVVSLEADEFENLPADTYVRGYIRAFASLVELDVDVQLQHYQEYLQALRDTTIQVTKPELSKSKMLVNRRAQVIVVAAMGIVIVLSLVFWVSGVFDGTKVPVVVRADNSGNSVGTGLIEEQKTAAAVLAAAATPTSSASLTETEIEEPVSAQPDLEAGLNNALLDSEVNSVAEEGAAGALAPSLDQLFFEFTAECWVEIKDAGGKVLFADIQQDGDVLRLEGQAPFNIMLGDAGAVTLLLNDTPVDTTPSNNRKAKRFSVGL